MAIGKILITGSNGLIGSTLLKNLHEDAIGLSKEELDVSNSQCTDIIYSINPSVVIHTAAIVSSDQAEKDPEKAFLTNTEGTKNVAICCRRLNIPMLFFSTCGVFDGNSNTPYTTEDVPNPVSVYAKTKVEAELEIQRLLEKFYILRSAYVYGRSKPDFFISGSIDRLKSEINPTFPIIDQTLGISNVENLCSAAIDLIKGNHYGTYHYSDRGYSTRLGVLQYISKVLNKTEFKITHYEGAPRPQYTVLDTSKIEPYLSKPIPHWMDSLKEFIKCDT